MSIAVWGQLAQGVESAEGLDTAARQAALRSKADECLRVAASQMRQRMYAGALATLEECQGLGEGLSGSQQSLLARYRREASEGQNAGIEAEMALMAGDQYLAEGQLALAQAEYGKAYGLREFLAVAQAERIEVSLDQIKIRQSQLKTQMKAGFIESVKQYRSGELVEAQAGFEAILASGVKLGFFDRGGDFTDVQGYLKKIAKKMPRERSGAAVVAAARPQEAAGRSGANDESSGGGAEVAVEYVAVEASDQSESGVGDLTEDELVDVITPEEVAVSAAAPTAKSRASAEEHRVEAEPKKKKSSWWVFGGDKGPSAETLEKVSELLAQGNLAMGEGNSSLARQYFSKALELHPESEAARRALSAAEYDLMHPQASKPRREMSILDRARSQERVQREAIEASFISTRNSINRLLAQERFDEANAEVSQLLASAEAAKQLLGSETYERISSEARAIQEQVRSQQEHHVDTVLKSQIDMARAAELGRQRKAEAARQEKIDGLFERAMAFRDAREFDQAVGTLDRLLALDPEHKQAEWMREDMELMQMLSEQEATRRLAAEEEAKVFKEVRESAIPWSDRMTFGDHERWLENRAKRGAVQEEQYSGSPQKRATLEKLDTVTIELDFVDAEFQQILNEITEETEIKFLPAWASLATGEILADDVITVQATNITVGAALDYMLAEVSAGKWDTAGYVVDDQGFVSINAVTILGEAYQYYEKVYSVSDLLNVDSGDLGGGGGGETDTDEEADELTEMIEDTVLPESWGEGSQQGGRREDRFARLSVSGNFLVVRQTRDGHRRIEALLQNLRASLSEQVTIEVRFLVINSNFLEDIGFDFDFFLNLNNAGYDMAPGQGPYGQRVLTPRTDPGPWNRTTPVPIQQDGYDWARSAGTGIPGSLGGDASVSAFRLAGSFLDNIQVDFLMRATQAHQRSRSLTAPHCTVISGENVSIDFSTQVTYVNGWTVVVGDSVALPEPSTASLDLGIGLSLTPTISANKRYIVMNFNVSQRILNRMATFAFGGQNIQLPEWSTNTLNTRVSVPDGGTLLLGGQKLTAEVEKEIGVPALSKIPILNRIFSNRSITRDESVLLILLKPSILLQSEEEEKHFGSL